LRASTAAPSEGAASEISASDVEETERLSSAAVDGNATVGPPERCFSFPNVGADVPCTQSTARSGSSKAARRHCATLVGTTNRAFKIRSFAHWLEAPLTWSEVLARGEELPPLVVFFDARSTGSPTAFIASKRIEGTARPKFACDVREGLAFRHIRERL
jgi:hypothetical protein